MKKNFLTDREKTINSALFILDKLGGQCDFHKLFKILYFADQKHLVKYGTSFSGDFYVAMKHGPVPSDLYDVLKDVRDGRDEKYIKFFSVNPSSIVITSEKPDLDVLSESNLECLVESINENRSLGFNALTSKSHGKAWESAQEQTDMIGFLDIASEGGADKEMLKYIEFNLENQTALSYATPG